MKTSDLTGITLDWAVAKCEGASEHLLFKEYVSLYNKGKLNKFSTDWTAGGPIIEREFIATFNVETHPFEGEWAAEKHYQQQSRNDEDGSPMYSFYEQGLSTGPTILVAAMRCYVESKLGKNVDVPGDLLT